MRSSASEIQHPMRKASSKYAVHPHGAAVRDGVERMRSLPVAPPVIIPATFLFVSILYRNKGSMVKRHMEA